MQCFLQRGVRRKVKHGNIAELPKFVTKEANKILFSISTETQNLEISQKFPQSKCSLVRTFKNLFPFYSYPFTEYGSFTKTVKLVPK